MNGKAAIFSEDGGLISHRRCRLNKQFGNMAGKVLLLGRSARLNDSNSIQLLC